MVDKKDISGGGAGRVLEVTCLVEMYLNRKSNLVGYIWTD